MMIVRGCICAVLFASAPIAAAQPIATPATKVAADAERVLLALELVKMTYPAARAKASSVDAFERDFRQSFLSSPQNVAAAARYPGLVDVMVAAGRDEMSKITSEIEPKIFDTIAQGVSDMMSFDDLRKTVAFYRSPAGQAILSLDPATMNADGTISLVSLSEDHRRAIGRYQQSSAGQRANQATAQAMARVPTVVNEIFPTYQPRLASRIRAAGNSFMASKRPKK
jgi:hypothetical protein